METLQVSGLLCKYAWIQNVLSEVVQFNSDNVHFRSLADEQGRIQDFWKGGGGGMYNGVGVGFADFYLIFS